MRKRSTKEILELSLLQARSFSENIEDEQIKQQNLVDREKQIKSQKEKDNKEKGSLPGSTAPNTSEISSTAKNTATAPTPDVTVHALRENGETTWHGPGWNTIPS